MQALNLKALAEASAATSASPAAGEVFFQEGIQALEQTLRSGFEDKQALQVSCRAFEKMLAFDDQDYRPYLFSGYLLLLMESYAEAEAYLEHAAKLNPQAADAGTLLQLVRENRELPVFRDWIPGLSRHQQQVDLARLAQELEGHVQARLKSLMELPPLGQAIVSGSAECDKLQALLSSLDRFLVQVKEPLALLQETQEPQVYERLMQPLLQRQAQLNAQLELAGQVARIRRQLGTATQTAIDLNKSRHRRSPGEVPGHYAAQCEALFDRCDQLADQLDQLQAAGHDIAPLEKNYDRLVRMASQLQQELAARHPERA